MSRELRKYNEDALFFIPAIDAGAVDFVTSPTLAAGDGKLFSYGGGAPQINTNLAAEMVAFTSGSEEPANGDTLVGATSTETAVFMFAVVTSGTWGGGDASGFLFVKSVSGAFSAENLNISGGTANVMTIGADFTAGLVGSIGNGDIVFALTAAEMQCQLGNVTFIDSATKDWEDNKLYFATFGNANAQYAMDFSTTVPTAAENVNEWESQSQSDPTGFHVNVLEVGGTSQTSGDLAALIATLTAYVDTEVAAILAAVDTEVTAILVDTNELQTDLVDGGRLDLLIDAILADTNEVQGDLADGGRLDLLIDSIVTATAASAIRTALGMAAADLDTQLDTIAAYIDTEVAAILAAVDTEMAAVLADTNELQTDWVNGGRLDLLLDAMKAVTDALTSAGATKLALSMTTVVTGTVNDANTTPSTTTFAAEDITEATADHFIGRNIIFTSGALQNQVTDITDYALASSEGVFTVTALTEAPIDGDTFIII